MSDINEIKGNIKVNVLRTLAGIITIISSIIGYKKAKNKKMKALNVITGIAGAASLVLEAEKDFKPIDYKEEE